MKDLLRLSALAVLGAVSLFASIDGTILNGTTGKPQPGISVTLVKPGQGGMRTLGTITTDASGHFLFQNDEPGGGPQLLQANFEGVNYNKLLTPNIPTSNVELDVFQSTKSPAAVQLAQRMLVVEPTISQVAVNETVIVQNPSKETFNNPDVGGLRFYLPPAANGQVRINAQGPQGMPLPRAAEKTETSDIFKIDFPVKPGQTEFEITYTLPVGSPMTFHGRVTDIKGMQTSPLRVIAPSGVTLSGKDIQLVGTEPKTQAAIYTVTAPDIFSFDVKGTGSLHAGGEAANSPDTSDEPPLTEGKPQIYTHLPWLLALAGGILGVGLIVLYRSSPVRSPSGK
ncbi:MAG: hypothetical protein JO033_04500 [Acidobacteriaceae bacterium]|nr:hypothetical protein [Acidobacteriaceae bacterium]